MPSWDLAADDLNFFAPLGRYFNEAQNSLIQDWHHLTGWLWLNPPFGDIEPWAQKCAEASKQHAKILFLVPASVGSYWYATHVHNVAARVMFLSPRISFDGKAPFPKDCVLVDYDKDVLPDSGKTYYECWRWK